MPESATRLVTLRRLLAERFPPPERAPDGVVPTGVAAVDAALGGGLAAGRLTELVSAPGSGGQFVLARLLASVRAARRRAALVDAADGFAPEALPADDLRHLVWVRSRDPEQTFAAADLLVRDGNYAAIVLDLRGVEAEWRRRPATAWFRLQRVAEGGAAVLVQTAAPLVPSVPWRLVLRSALPLDSRRWSQERIAARLAVEVERVRAAPEERTG